MLARLTLDIIDHDGIVEVDPIIREVELPENNDRIIDAVEETVLGLKEGATRTPRSSAVGAGFYWSLKVHVGIHTARLRDRGGKLLY